MAKNNVYIQKFMQKNIAGQLFMIAKCLLFVFIVFKFIMWPVFCEIFNEFTLFFR